MIPKDLVLIADPSGSWDVRRAGVASTGGRATDLGSDAVMMHLRFEGGGGLAGAAAGLLGAVTGCLGRLGGLGGGGHGGGHGGAHGGG